MDRVVRPVASLESWEGILQKFHELKTTHGDAYAEEQYIWEAHAMWWVKENEPAYLWMLGPPLGELTKGNEFLLKLVEDTEALAVL